MDRACRSAFARGTVLTLALLVTLAPAAALAQTPVGCGDVLTSDTTLTVDLLDCPGDGLIIAADGITLISPGTPWMGPVPQAVWASATVATTALRSRTARFRNSPGA